jgi:hypothetical protein
LRSAVLSLERHRRRSLPTLTLALLGNLPVTAMVALCVLKLAATVTSYSSGGSGGIFAPALFMGGMLGGAVGYLDVTVFHHPADSIGAFAVVGMGAVFAGIVRAPMTSILIIFEMTGGYGLVLPLMIANMSAFALARHWRHTPVYEALLEQDGIYLDRQAKSRPIRPGGAVPKTEPNRTPLAKRHRGRVLGERPIAAAPQLLRLLVVEEVGAQLEIGAVELPRQRRIAGAVIAPQAARSRPVSPERPSSCMSVTWPLGRHLEANGDHALT